MAAQSSSLASSAQSDFLSRFAGQNQTISSLGNILQNVQNGKLLPGFDSQTMAALNTNAIDTTASNYRSAAQAAGNANAGRGGDSGLQPGTVSQENATIASQAAGQLSSQQQQIQLANQQQAQQNTATALGGYQTLAGIQNPLGFEGGATQTNQNAFTQADTVQQENNQEQADIAGGVAGIAMDAATFGAGAVGGGGFAGGLKALAG